MHHSAIPGPTALKDSERDTCVADTETEAGTCRELYREKITELELRYVR